MISVAKPIRYFLILLAWVLHIVTFLGCPALVAQTKIYGDTAKPTAIYGDTTFPTVINAAPTYTRIFVVFPPSTGQNNTNFVASVMPQSAIDGVTIPVPWNSIEDTLSPTQIDCTASMPPDKCQPDIPASGWFHTYSWSTFDNNTVTNPCTAVAGTSSQWFCGFPNNTTNYKQVSFELFGIGDSPANGFTPSYVTTNTVWIAATNGGVGTQDVVNTVNASGCSSAYAGSYTIPVFSTFTGNGTMVTVTWSGAHSPFVDGDIIWVSGAGSGYDTTGVTGQPVSNVSYSSGNGSFQYPGTGTATKTVLNSALFTLVNSTQSWPIPYEAPYSTAYQAFLRAAIYHFNHLNTVRSGSGWNFKQTTAEIGYIRPGVARGGEAIPICTTGTVTTNPMIHPTSPSHAYSSMVWENWYKQVNAAVQSASPLMQIMYSINAGDPASRDATIATAEAGFAVSYSSSSGLYNGFGGQGLQITDDMASFLPCPGSGTPTTSNNWGCMFLNYWSGASPTTANPTTVPLELQQIDCSNPCTSDGCYEGSSADQCFEGDHSPGLTGDLRVLYPFATSNYVSILELYSQDALLAFDPNFCLLATAPTYCNLTSTGDDFTTKLSAETQNSFFQDVGIGKGKSGSGTCYTPYVSNPTLVQSSATGDCSYANYISAAHGPH